MKPRKIQLHSSVLQMWNFKGADDFSAFNPKLEAVLSNDVWLCNAVSNVTLTGDLLIRPGDLVLALQDEPDALSATSVTSGHWKIIRHLRDAELQWIDEQMNPYVPPSGSVSGSQTLEKSLQQSDYTVTVNWTTTEGTNAFIAKRLQKRLGGGAWTTVTDLSLEAISGSETVDIPINTDTSFRLEFSSKSGETLYSGAISVTWQYKVFVTIDDPSPSLNDTWLKAADQDIWGGSSDTPFRSISGNLLSGKHMFYAVPMSMVSAYASNSPDPYLRPLYFKWDVGEGGFTVVATNVTYAFPDGRTTEDYVVFRTNQAGLGQIVINVTSTP